MKYALFYEPGPATAEAMTHYPAHRARIAEFHRRGAVLMVGTFENPEQNGAMGIFTSREAAEEFARGDPFVLNGVVGRWCIRGWNEVLAP